MNNFRNKRISKQIQQDLSDIIGQIARDNYRGKMISVSEIRLTDDLSIAKVFLSIFPTTDSQLVIDDITARTKQIRFELGKKIKNQVRKIPELKFVLDKSYDEMEKINKLLKK